MKTARLAFAAAAALAATFPAHSQTTPEQAPPPATRGAGAEHRLFTRFVEDAAIVPSYWLEGKVFYEGNHGQFDANLLGIGPVFALNVAEDLEFGARIAVARLDSDLGGADTGLTDLDLWGKISVVSDPVRISLGLLLTAPTGDEDNLLGTGETNVEFFGGIRKDFSRVTFAGNTGFRVNQDVDIDSIGIEGKNSWLLGAAALFPAGDNLVLTVEWSLETERFEGFENDSRLLGGAEYRASESLLYRGAIGGGLSDGAPDLLATGGVVWLF